METQKIEIMVLSEIDEIKDEISKLEKVLYQKRIRLKEIDGMMNSGKIDNSILKERKILLEDVERFDRIVRMVDDVYTLIEIWKEDKDDSAFLEAQRSVDFLKKEIKALKIRLLLSEKYDRENAIIEITPGAGGTESMDWADMLMRMYVRWAKKYFSVTIVDKMAGQEAGIKSATLLVEGNYAYGFLKGETGIHRLVRISPFDANRRRHTSFAAVTVYPEIEESPVEIREEDLEIETFRASGPGGQYVNKTDSAVRIKHLPTGIVVTCQSERSQYKNKQTALRILISRLYQLQKKKLDEERESVVGEKKDISWGNQIRSYILYPYKLVKDHRTGFETQNVDEVLDGDLDDFIESFLIWSKTNK